jgi:pilus assembly protein CpaE
VQARPIRVLIADDSEQARAAMRQMLTAEGGFEVVGEAADGRSAVERVRALRPDAAVVDVLLPGIGGIEAARVMASEAGTAVVLVSVEGAPEFMRQAMASGARDYLVKPFSGPELAQAVRSACSGRRGTAGGRLVVFFGAKGGAGRTLLAVNVAVAAGRLDPARPTVLADLALPFGDAAAHCGLVPQSHLGDACRSDPALLDEMCEAPPGLPIRVLAAPADPVAAAELERSGSEGVGRVLESLLERFPRVVADTAPNLGPVTLRALERADAAVAVTTPEVPALQDTSRLLHLLVNDLGYGRERIRVVVNRTHPAASVSMRVVSEVLGFPVAMEVPFDPVAAGSVGVNLPPAGRRRRTPLALAAYDLVPLLFGAAAPAEQADAGPAGAPARPLASGAPRFAGPA